MARRPARTQASLDFKETKAYARAAKRLGLRIRGLRERQGLTLQDADELIGINFRHLAKVEAGQLNVTLATMMRIAMGLGSSLEALFAAESSVGVENDVSLRPKYMRPASAKRKASPPRS